MLYHSANPYERDLVGARFFLWAAGLVGVICLAGLIAVLLTDHTSHRWFDWQWLAGMSGICGWIELIIAVMYIKVRRDARALSERGAS